MTHPRINQRLLQLFLSAFLAAGAFLAALPVLGSRSQEANTLLFGYSSQRLALAGVLILSGILFGWIGFQAGKDTPRARRFSSALLGSEAALHRLFWTGLALCFLGWVGSALPSYRVPEGLGEYLQRLRPFMFWLSGVGLAALLLLLAERRSAGARPALAAPAALSVARFTLVVFMLIWLLVLLTGLGLRIREDYWYGAGVPALPLQVLFSAAAGLMVGRLEITGRLRGQKRSDLLLFLLIWVLAAILWAREPMRPSFFMPGPSFPNRDFYPFSDASRFDLGSQFALIGQGLFNGQYFDRVLYSAFLTYLHALAGQNFIQVTAAQAAIFAVFPAIVYLIGRELGGRALGAASAVLIALRGMNSIAAAGWIDLASPRMMLTDFPTAILLAWFTLLIIRWLKDPGGKWHTALWAGCALGLAVLLRTHALLLLPLVALLALVSYHFSWRPWLAGVSLLALGMMLATLPWDLRSNARGAPLFSTYFHRIELIIKERYNLWPADDTSAAGSFAALEAPGRQTASPHTALMLVQPRPRCEGLVCSGINHFLHNMITSVLFLPTSPGLDNLRQTVKEAFPYWQQGWLGDGFSPLWAVFLAINLALIALGIGSARTERGGPGLVPLFIYLGYGLSNAFALTSGGRYIVPTDWIVCIYFLLGALSAARWGWNLLHGGDVVLAAQPADPLPRAAVGSFPQRLRTGLIAAALVLAIGSLIPFSEQLFPRRYAGVQYRSQVLAELRDRGLLTPAGLELTQIKDFLADQDARLLMGRGLYPRYYEARKGESSSGSPYRLMDFPRLAFTLIGPQGQRGVVLPGQLPFSLPNGSDVIVLGCFNKNYMDALAVFVLDEPAEVYTRSPEAPLECPVKPPICVNKERCY